MFDLSFKAPDLKRNHLNSLKGNYLFGGTAETWYLKHDKEPQAERSQVVRGVIYRLTTSF